MVALGVLSIWVNGNLTLLCAKKSTDFCRWRNIFFLVYFPQNPSAGAGCMLTAVRHSHIDDFKAIL